METLNGNAPPMRLDKTFLQDRNNRLKLLQIVSFLQNYFNTKNLAIRPNFFYCNPTMFPRHQRFCMCPRHPQFFSDVYGYVYQWIFYGSNHMFDSVLLV